MICGPIIDSVGKSLGRLDRLGNTAISGRVRWTGKPTACPFRRVGLHGIDLVALHATELRFASPVGYCHQELFALRAAVIVHGILPCFGDNLGPENSKGSLYFH
jgi:hypothetical protein